MKLCTTAVVDGPTGKKHFAVVSVGQPGWPMALCGPAEGRNAKKNEAEARFFASAPAMSDMLEVLVSEFGNINPEFPLAPGKLNELQLLVERASKLLASHRA